MSKLFTCFILCFLALHASSQLPLLDWAKGFEALDNNSLSIGTTVGTDENGNVYSAGQFEKSIDFDPGPGVFTITAAGPFDKAMYISKLDANGNFVWAKQIPNYMEFGRIEIKVDKVGNIYFASDLNVAADVDPGPGVHILSPTGFRDAFILKLNSDGGLVWAKQFGGPGDTGPQAYMIELDKDNNVIIGGIFNNTVDFDPGPGTLNLTSSAHMQAFVAKLNNNGDLIWAKQFGNGPEVYSGCSINDIKCDATGNIIVIGSFNRTCDFDPGPGVYNLTSSPGSSGDGFICKLDAGCNFIWIKTFGQTGSNNYFMTPTGIDIDSKNNILTTGFFIGGFDFDPGAAEHIVFANPHDCYILKLDGQGNFIWVKIIGNPTESDTGHDIVTDSDGNVYCVGSFGSSVDFDPGPGVNIINNPSYGSTLLKLSSAGDFLYAAPFVGYNYIRRMQIDAARHIYIAGFMAGINDFDPGPGTYELAAGQRAPFVLKLSPCLNATNKTLNISACKIYTLNNQSFDSSGTYVQIIPNAAGCDSVITLHLTINKKFIEQTKTICEGSFFFAGGAYQQLAGIYYDTLLTVLGCDSFITTHLAVNPKPLPDLGTDKNLCRNTTLSLTPGNFTSYLWQDNSTASEFTVNSSGVYWVQVTNKFNCVATDTFKVLSVVEPPANFMKNTDSICSYKDLELVSTRSYTSYQWSTGAATKNILVQSPGLYWLKVTDNNGCTGVDSILVYAKNCMFGIYIPTAFTPDKNGINDKFKPIVYGKTLQYNLVVYNRFGSIVFKSTDPNKGWDGSIRGVLQENAAFVWTCSYQLEGRLPKTEKGTVLLLR
jgi:gliding motility-associated-like protein